jgi:hypothetical protein
LALVLPVLPELPVPVLQPLARLWAMGQGQSLEHWLRLIQQL